MMMKQQQQQQQQKQHIAIFTTASLPWLTGTAVNPLFRAAYLAKDGQRRVTLVIPWLTLNHQVLVYPNNITFASPSHQEAYVRRWLEDRVSFPLSFEIRFYPGKFATDKRSILPVGDISDTIPDEEADIAVLEEPEHLTWFHHGKKWKTKFNYVIGIVHTNYLEYVKREKQGRLKAFLLKYLNSWVVGIYCHKVIRLSDATQEYPKSIVCNVHGVNPKFLEIGLKKLEQQKLQEQPFTKGAYYIGKMVWSKGYKELLKLLKKHQKELSGLEVDLYGSGEDSEEIKEAARKLDLTVNVYPGRDHADPLFHNYKVFLNPSTTDVVCTTTAEALAMGKIVVCADHTSNEFFKQFPNCRVYDDGKGFVRATLKALGEQPSQLTEQQRHELSWEAATQRFIRASDLNRLARADSNLSKKSLFASSSISVGKNLEDMSAYIHFLASGFETSRTAFGAIPGSLQPDEELCKDLGLTLKTPLKNKIILHLKQHKNMKPSEQEAPKLAETLSNISNDSSASEKGEARTQQPSNNGYALTVDEVIEQHIGALGFAQIMHALLVSIAWTFDAQTTLVSIFSDAQPAARLLATGAIVEGSLMCGMSTGEWEWVGGKSDTIVSEWDLICQHKFLVALPSTLFFIGSLFGSGVYGYLADSWFGRKKTLFLSCLLTFVTALAISFAPNIWVYAFLRFANGFFRSGIGSCCIVLATEVVGKKWRGQVGQYGFFFFTLGFLSLPLMGYLERKSWRNLYRIISVLPLGYALFLLPFAYESPRWLLVKGRNKEAMVVLKKLARLNGKQLPAELSLVDPIQGRDDQTSSSENFWKTKWAVKRIVMVMMAGFGSGFVYYGIQLNAENLNFNLYLTVAVNAMMEFPAVFIGSFLLGVMNRRPLFSNSSYLAGISCLLCAVLSLQRVTKAMPVAKWLQLAVEAVGFMASSTAYDVLYVYAVELFPTNVRNFAVSLLRQAFMLGASAAPLLVALGRESAMMSFIVFGVASVLSGVVSLWLRETRNAPLYETLRQQEKAEEMENRTEDT